MNKIIKRVGVLLVIFIIAVAIYFVWAQNTTEKTDTVYTSMEEATLPVVYTKMYGKDMNCLRGYLQEMGQAVARETLTILPSDRNLELIINQYEGHITGISYEIRSLDQEQLVERTTLEAWNTAEQETSFILPIQNLLLKEKQYLLDLSVSTEERGAIHYYTRIMWTDHTNVDQLITFATDFSAKTFDYDQARELTTYLETSNTEDNSSLGTVTIRSSFSQLTWGELGVQPLGDILVSLRELDGIMANVQLEYLVSRDTEAGEKEVYEVKENFTMKWSTQRIYLMDYTRQMNQIFTGAKSLFAGKRIMLGITEDSSVRTTKSPDGNMLSFVANRDLWSYNQEKKTAVKVFSFRNRGDDKLRSGYRQHDIKILSVKDTGEIDFLVYGYMNRGMHEGKAGITYYRFNPLTDMIEEKFFAPVSMSYDILKEDLGQLSYLGANDMFYMLVNHAIYAIDINSNESMVVVDALTEGSYAVSEDGTRLAWQEGSGLYGSKVIHLMNLVTGTKQELFSEDGELLRVLGFVGEDFIYGMAYEQGEWTVNGRVEELPMYALLIVDDNLNVETRYENADSYIAGVSVDESRIHFNRIAKLSEGQYSLQGEDTLVCNTHMGISDLAGIGWYASNDRRKLYFVQTDQEITENHGIHVSAPKSISFEAAGILELKANTLSQQSVYYAYGNGRLLGIREKFSEAVEMAYGQMGFVADQNQEIVWNRVDRGIARNFKDPEAKAKPLIRAAENGLSGKSSQEGATVVDARGCSLNQVLYFVDQGCPVVAFVESGEYVLISGYDQYNVTLYSPATGEFTKMGLNDGADYFKNIGNDFICALLTE